MGTSNSGSQSTQVLIIGSGPTGLLLAQGLKKSGIKAIVFERYDEDKIASYSRDWNFGLHWGHDSLVAMLPSELADKLKDTQTDPTLEPHDDDTLPFKHGETGDIILRIPTGKFIRYTRSKLLNLLKQGIDLRCGKELTNIRYGDARSVIAEFGDGTAATGQLLVGADGTRSAVRKLLLGPKAEPRRLPYTAVWTQKTGFSREQAIQLRQWNPQHMAGVHPAGMFMFHGMQDVPDLEDPTQWKYFFYISWPSSIEWQDSAKDFTSEQWLAEGRKRASMCCDPWPIDFGSLADDHPMWHIFMSDWDPSAEGCKWDTHDGRVTLAGDAAHSITFQRGQGLNHSLQDVVNLWKEIIACLGPNAYCTQADAIARYEEEMVARTGAETKMCTMNTHMLHDWSKVQQSPVFKRGVARA
ncbi:FAD/NAD(P)-binding domain-containing protein [Rhizodiscina lignyota]|uniref:FAD/NAD(P)-binding domain-containing protein n=1 Tax=Rhizodiscina lignyota TaxID=1504668 RepID=A0A9P4IGL1_9PEZI|nr:FAD/NAD(P)-binding domain-containing protein [Rhizodiscina lignyota]